MRGAQGMAMGGGGVPTAVPAGLSPIAFWVTALIVYGVPSVRPLNETGPPMLGRVCVAPPGDKVTRMPVGSAVGSLAPGTNLAGRGPSPAQNATPRGVGAM